jgi:hypothetical protein
MNQIFFPKSVAHDETETKANSVPKYFMSLLHILRTRYNSLLAYL